MIQGNTFKTFGGIAAFLFTFATVLPAEVYQYTGMNYTSVSGSPYSTAQSVTGTFTFNDPLATGLTISDQTGSVTSWNIYDGVNALSDSTGGTLTNLTLSTDMMGNISSWYFEAQSAGNVDVYSGGPVTPMDYGTDGANSGTSTVGGTWEDTTPEPGTLGMMLAGGLLLFGTMRRRAGKASRPA